jgi:hypothetical protein
MPASDVQDCADLLRHDASNGAAWRGLAFRFAPSDADALPNPAIVIAASVGDGRSLRAVANWLAARHARRQSGTIGRLLAEAARRDPALVGDYAEWLVSWPNLGRAALVEIGDHLDTTANSAGPLAHFERGRCMRPAIQTRFWQMHCTNSFWPQTVQRLAANCAV